MKNRWRRSSHSGGLNWAVAATSVSACRAAVDSRGHSRVTALALLNVNNCVEVKVSGLILTYACPGRDVSLC